ncbi:hypothetical protein [Nocardia sp. NPDC057440]|uniref:hypothetical protein n=1 Tax=Nocardia sp. NPDC057440 TaxID=3346134 RepID=UPI0036717B0F
MKSVAKVDTKKESLLGMDDIVHNTSAFMVNEQNRTLRSIEIIVTKLAEKVNAEGDGKLKPAKETALLQQVADAVEAVRDKVNAMSQTNNDIAYGGSARRVASGKGPVDDAEDGAGAGGLAGMIQALAPMGMAAMPQAQGPSDLVGGKAALYEDRIDIAPPLRGGPNAALPGIANPPGNPAAQHFSTAAPISAQPAPISSSISTSGPSRPESGLPVTPWSGIAKPASRIRRRADTTGSTEGPLVSDDSAEAEDAAMAEIIRWA